MKKNYFLSVALLLLVGNASFAQVVNGDFETVKPNFLPSNWGMTFLQQFAIDTETGETFGDQIQFTWCIPSMVYASTDANTGQYAMEISNAYNSTQDTVIPGWTAIFSDPEQDSPGWNPGIPVEENANVTMFGFFYKFMPVGNDIAQARISVTDAEGNEIGQASIDISGTHNTYQYVYEPITYTSNAAPAFMYITFSMAKEGSIPTFGSRLIIDNVVTNFAALNLNTTTLNSKVSVFPTVADNELNVDTKGLTEGPVSYKVMNTEGKIVKQNVVNEGSSYVYTMDVSGISSGMYFITIDSSLGQITKKFIKK